MDVAIVRMTSLYDLASDSILFGGNYIPIAFFRSSDELETAFIHQLFMLLREVSSLNLTETEIALYAAMVLMWPRKYLSLLGTGRGREL